METRPCKCGGEYNVYGGQMLGASLMTKMVAVCDKCDNYIDGYEKPVGRTKDGIQHIHKSFDSIEEVNEEIRRQNGLRGDI